MNKVYILILLFAITSCGSKKSIIEKNYETDKIIIYGRINEIIINDSRKDTTSRELKIPKLSFPGQSDIIQPSLTQFHKDSITKQIKSYFLNSEDNFNITVEVTKGLKEFNANAFNEREFVQFGTKITLSNLNNNDEKNCSSTAFFETKSIDASNEFVDKLYLKAIRTSVYKCFTKLIE